MALRWLHFIYANKRVKYSIRNVCPVDFFLKRQLGEAKGTFKEIEETADGGQMLCRDTLVSDGDGLQELRMVVWTSKSCLGLWDVDLNAVRPLRG